MMSIALNQKHGQLATPEDREAARDAGVGDPDQLSLTCGMDQWFDFVLTELALLKRFGSERMKKLLS